MSLRLNLFAPRPLQQFPKFQTNPFFSYSSSRPHLIYTSSRLRISISCTGGNNSLRDAELALKLTREVEKLNSQTAQREEALNKSRELLFNELSSYMGSKVEEAGKKWRKMSEDDKWAVALKLTREVEKLNSQTAQREEALNKSRKLLFNELSSYMGSKVEEAGKKWRKMSEDDKWAVVNGFVSE